MTTLRKLSATGATRIKTNILKITNKEIWGIAFSMVTWKWAKAADV